MANREQTTVNLTEKAQTVKEDLAPVFGLKNILSAGLILLSELSDTEQKQKIKQANSSSLPTKSSKPQTLRDVLKNIVHQQQKKPGTIIKISPSDEKLWDMLKRLVAIEPEKQKKKVKKA